MFGRWDHRLTIVLGGPGFGKTTLLAQAVVENRLAPRGRDLWVAVERPDAADDSLARAVGTAAAVLHDGAAASSDPATVADALWRCSPVEVCLILDDVHLLPVDSPGAAWLGELLDRLPSNGHLVLAGRSEPPIARDRVDALEAQGQIVRLSEDELRFSGEELDQFAARHGTDVGRFADSAGWPAMTELAASVERHLTGAYLWEEVLGPLGTDPRRVLAVLCDLGGADDALASAALGSPVRLADALADVPLVGAAPDGWSAPHALWSSAPGIELAADDRAAVRGRAVEHLLARGRYDDAFNLASEAELWSLVPGILRAACTAGNRPGSSQVRRWLAASPPEVLATPAGRLAAGLDAAFSRPTEAPEPLRLAVEACRAAGDADGELTALAQLGRVAWWYQDLDELGPVGLRVTELAGDGHPVAQGLAAIGRAVVTDIVGDDPATLAALESIEPGLLDPGWEAVAAWLRGRVLLFLGDVDTPLELADRAMATADPAMRIVLHGLRLTSWWAQGQVDQVVEQLPETVDAGITSGIEYNRLNGLAQASTILSHVGQVERAERMLRDIDPRRDSTDVAREFLTGAVALASLRLAQGEADQAAAELRRAIESDGLDRGTDRRLWRQSLALSYVLLPEAREHWEATDLRGHLATARDLAAAVVALRTGGSDESLAKLAADLPDAGTIRSALHYRFAAELAVGLATDGRPEGGALLDALGPAGRTAVRDLASGSTRAGRGRQARALLAAAPAPPPRRRHVALLGPLTLREDGEPGEGGAPGGAPGEEVTDPDLRRERVRMLLAFLVGHRRTDRAAVTEALWPELGEDAAANNLRVTLNYLLRVLEPWRAPGEPPFIVRVRGPGIELVVGDHLRLDVDRFDEHLAAAARAEESGAPLAALDHNLAAVDLYRGDFHAGGLDADWLQVEREHYRTRFVAAATRAAQLLVGRDETERSAALARRALAVDPWAEDAYVVLAAGALTRGDRTSAHRVLERCEEVLADLGVEPSETTRQLRRRVRTGV